MEDTWEYLKTENAVPKFESYIRGWMKQIQELLLESEQLRLETDDAGPQVWKSTLTRKNQVWKIQIYVGWTGILESKRCKADTSGRSDKYSASKNDIGHP